MPGTGEAGLRFVGTADGGFAEWSRMLFLIFAFLRAAHTGSLNRTPNLPQRQRPPRQAQQLADFADLAQGGRSGAVAFAGHWSIDSEEGKRSRLFWSARRPCAAASTFRAACR